MRCLRPWLVLALILSAGTSVLLNRLQADGPTSPRDSGEQTPPRDRSKPEKPAKDDETVQVAKLIDSIIQPRFSKDAGQFGLRRLATLDGHEPVIFTAEDKTEKGVLKKVDAFGRDYFIAFLHMAHKPGKYVRPQPGNTDPGGARPDSAEMKPRLSAVLTARTVHGTDRNKLSAGQWSQLLKVTTDHLPDLRKGKDASASFEKFAVTLRPVVAQKTCLECHAGAKEGEALGVMLYAVEKNATERSADSAE